MARSVNKSILLGYIGQDPEIRYTPAGRAVANISLATSRAWLDRESGQKKESTEWHRIVFFDRLAEVVGEYARRGTRMYVEGFQRTRDWIDAAQQKRFITEIVGREMVLLESKPDAEQGVVDESGAAAASPRSSTTESPAGIPLQSLSELGAFDDDIPF